MLNYEPFLSKFTRILQLTLNFFAFKRGGVGANGSAARALLCSNMSVFFAKFTLILQLTITFSLLGTGVFGANVSAARALFSRIRAFLAQDKRGNFRTTPRKS